MSIIDTPVDKVSLERASVDRGNNKASRNAGDTSFLFPYSDHPLCGEFQSTERGSVMQLTLDSNSFYFNDHIVGGKKVFPAAAVIEMMRAAASCQLAKPVVHLKQLKWLVPLEPNGQPTTLWLQSHDTGSQNANLRVLLQNQRQTNDNRSNGKAWGAAQSDVKQTEQRFRRKTNLATLEKRCGDHIQKAQLYSLFAESGIDYGCTFQSVETLQSTPYESLARIKLPDYFAKASAKYLLHPVLLDGAFQAVAGIVNCRLKRFMPNLLVPFSLKHLQIYSGLPDDCFAHVRLSQDPQLKQQWAVNIDITDSRGNVLVEIQQLVLREILEKR